LIINKNAMNIYKIMKIIPGNISFGKYDNNDVISEFGRAIINFIDVSEASRKIA